MPFEFDHETKNTVVFSRKHLTFSYCFLWEWFDLKFVFVGIIGHVFVIDKAFKNQVLKKKYYLYILTLEYAYAIFHH